MIRFVALFVFAFASLSSYADSGQCAATTKKGTQCKRNAASGSEYCWQHGGRSSATTKSAPAPAPETGTSVKKNTPAKNTAESTQCQATTKKGKQCSRKAKSGSSFCWQHGG